MEQFSCPRSRNHRRRTIKLMEGSHIEMIEVRVGKKHDVDLGEIANGQRRLGQTFGPERQSGQPDSNARKKNGIRQNYDPKKID